MAGGTVDLGVLGGGNNSAVGAISKPSEVQRRFGRIVMIWPSRTRPGIAPV